MKIVKVGDKMKRAACYKCCKMMPITFLLRDVPVKDSDVIVKGIIAGVCDGCSKVIIIPHQSSFAIKDALSKPLTALEVKLPRHLIDMLNMTSSSLDENIKFNNSLIRFYLNKILNNDLPIAEVQSDENKKVVEGICNARFSLKLKNSLTDIDKMAEDNGFKNKSELIKLLIAFIFNDIVKDKNVNSIKELIKISISSS